MNRWRLQPYDSQAPGETRFIVSADGSQEILALLTADRPIAVLMSLAPELLALARATLADLDSGALLDGRDSPGTADMARENLRALIARAEAAS